MKANMNMASVPSRLLSLVLVKFSASDASIAMNVNAGAVPFVLLPLVGVLLSRMCGGSTCAFMKSNSPFADFCRCTSSYVGNLTSDCIFGISPPIITPPGGGGGGGVAASAEFIGGSDTCR